MPFELSDVVPWGRSFAEYERMFALTDDDLRCKILACGDGPASFNVEATRRGASVVSVDPLYRFTRAEIERRIEETRAQVIDQAQRNREQFVWETFPTIEALEEARLGAMREFLSDYEQGHEQGRYRDASLPELPFDNGAFDLALCSHYLFLYDKQVDLSAHHAAMTEMCRVATEVRVFPLLALDGNRSALLKPVIEALLGRGLTATVETVDYEFQRGGNEMLRVTRE